MSQNATSPAPVIDPEQLSLGLRFDGFHVAPMPGQPGTYTVRPGRLRASFGGTLKTRDVAKDLGVSQKTAQRILAEIGGRRAKSTRCMLMVRPEVYAEWKRGMGLN